MGKVMDDMTIAALAGYRAEGGDKNPHYYSSTYWFLYEAGKYMNNKGFTAPHKAKMSRGYSVRIETVASTFIIAFGGNELHVISHERRD